MLKALATTGRDMGRSPRGTLQHPLSQGWDERRIAWYSPPGGERALSATWFRRDAVRLVLVLDWKRTSIPRLHSDVDAVVEGIHPKIQSESFAGRTPHVLEPTRLAAIVSFVAEAMAEADVPGASLAIVDRNGLLLERQLGTKRRGRPERIGPSTRFLVGSIQKPLTSLLLAKLADEGRLSWSSPVVSLFPSFRLGDPEMTARAQLKHLVCNCTGLPYEGPDAYFEAHLVTPASIFQTVATWKPTTGFGGTYSYSNFLFAEAGYIAGHVLEPRAELGRAFDDAMRTRVFEPLGMRDTTYDLARVEAGDHASPHVEDIDGASTPTSLDGARLMVPQRPAGAGWTTAADYARYLRVELSNGVLPDGRRFATEENLLARRAPQVSSGVSTSYGLGMTLDRTTGVLVVRHDGANVGYRSIMFFIPEAGVGGVLMTNSETGALIVRPFLRRVLELIFDGRPEAATHLAHDAMARREARTLERTKLTYPPEPAAVRDLAKRYHHPRLGFLDVRNDGPHTVFDFGEWHVRVALRATDDRSTVFSLVGDQQPPAWFTVGQRDGRRTLTMGTEVFVEVSP